MYFLRDDISEIVQILQNGGLICYPTDTVWAIGCDPSNEAAMARLNELKGGPPDKGYVLLVPDLEMLKTYAPKIHPRIETLLSFHTRPLTVLYDRTVGIPAAVKAPDNSAAIRLTTDEFCIALLTAFGKPLVSTIAAKKGAPYPPTFGGVSSEILGGVDYVVKHRQNDKEPQEPSSIAKLDRHLELEFVRD